MINKEIPYMVGNCDFEMGCLLSAVSMGLKNDSDRDTILKVIAATIGGTKIDFNVPSHTIQLKWECQQNKQARLQMILLLLWKRFMDLILNVHSKKGTHNLQDIAMSERPLIRVGLRITFKL